MLIDQFNSLHCTAPTSCIPLPPHYSQDPHPSWTCSASFGMSVENPVPASIQFPTIASTWFGHFKPAPQGLSHVILPFTTFVCKCLAKKLMLLSTYHRNLWLYQLHATTPQSQPINLISPSSYLQAQPNSNLMGMTLAWPSLSRLQIPYIQWERIIVNSWLFSFPIGCRESTIEINGHTFLSIRIKIPF